jgi:hypothetical protein
MAEPLDPPRRETSERTVLTLSTGARVGAMLAVLLLIVAGYLLWSPIQLYPGDGFPIMCGSGAQLPGDNLGSAACGKVNEIRQWQAGAVALAALVVALGSAFAFGFRRHREALLGEEPSDTVE